MNTNSTAQIIFYSRVNGEWEYQTSFRENTNNIDFNVVISEDTVIVDFHEYNNMNNNIIMYELKSDGTWWKSDNFPIQNLPTNPFYYQPGLSLNGDLACVCRYNCHLYHRDEAATWTLAAILDSGYQGCHIVGNEIALQDYNGDLSIYLYDETLVNASLVQDSIPAYYGFAMSHSHLVVADSGGSVSILRRDQNDAPFEFVEKLPIEHGDGQFVVDENVLVVGGQDQTAIYHQFSGNWKEVTTINEMYYGFQLSNNLLLATQENRIDSYNLESCSVDIGHASPAAAPTLSPTVATSSQVHESDCVEVDLRVVYNRCPTSVSWKLWKVNLARNSTEFYTLAAMNNETNANATESLNHLCLVKGEYNFGIFIDDYRCPYSSYGVVNYYEARESYYDYLLLAGGDVTVDETRRFSIH